MRLSSDKSRLYTVKYLPIFVALLVSLVCLSANELLSIKSDFFGQRQSNLIRFQSNDTNYLKRIITGSESPEISADTFYVMKKGLPDGIYMMYEADTLLLVTRYQNGKKEGSQAGYHRNGLKRFLLSYSEGKRDGSWISWFKNGQLNCIYQFKNDKAAGLWIDVAITGDTLSIVDMTRNIRVF